MGGRDRYKNHTVTCYHGCRNQAPTEGSNEGRSAMNELLVGDRGGVRSRGD